MRAKYEPTGVNVNAETGMEIAVIGMAGRFPGAENIDIFWENLKNGVDSITFFSHEELKEAGIESQLLYHPNYVKADGMLDGIDYFDSTFFEYTSREARLMDPQMRIFHECSWSALEDAGYAPGEYHGLTGLFAGASSNTQWEITAMLTGQDSAAGQFADIQLTDKDFMSMRISYKLNLTGPSITIYTACSTSLVAVHSACQSILNGECDMALAGGVTGVRLTKDGYIYQEGMINSPDGHTRTFDARAQGVVGGDGAGAVVLKRLEEAIADGDYIYAVVKGSAINNDGIAKVGFTAPSTEGLAKAVQIAQLIAEVDPETIGYVEAHGTATALGDPIEIEALTLAFKTDKRNYCAVGSVKTNVGHLGSAAGITGFIKTVLALHNRFIPPSLYFESPNPVIDFENSPFYINATLKEWTRGGFPLRAGVNSLGIGGTNAHVILEEAPARETGSRAPGPYLLLFSAKTSNALEGNIENFRHHIGNHPAVNLADAAYTLQVGRRAFKHKAVVVAADADDAIQASNPGTGRIKRLLTLQEKPPVILIFSGQGSQYVNMGLGLYQREPVFRREMDRCFEILEPIMGENIEDILYPRTINPSSTMDDKINQFLYTSPIKFAFEYALSKQMISWGAEPCALIGHSFGEYTAAHLAGVFSLEDGLMLAALRGKLMHQLPEGAMLSVHLPEDRLKPILTHQVSLAAVNGPNFCIVSGPTNAINDFQEKMTREGHECTLLRVPRAGHSIMTEPILHTFEERVRQIQLNAPQIPYISCVTGTWITAGQATDPHYWARHLRETVRFSDGLTGLLKKDNAIFLQMGSDRSLSTFVQHHPDKTKEHHVINLIRHPKDDIDDLHFLMDKIGLLWGLGMKIHWKNFYPGERRLRLPLPTYSFERKHYPIPADLSSQTIARLLDNNESPQLTKKNDIADWFYTPQWQSSVLPPLPPGDSLFPRRCLLFMNQEGPGSRMAQLLESHGTEVIVVKIGSAFIKENQRLFTVNPGEPGDFKNLFREIISYGEFPGKIIHMALAAPCKDLNPHSEIFKINSNLAFYSLLNIARAIAKLDIANDIQLDVVTSNMQDVTGEETLHPWKAAVLGPVKVIPQEYPNIRCHSIDVFLPVPGSKREDQLLEHLLTEIAAPSPDLVVAYRGNLRWQQFFKPIRLEENLENVPVLRENGTYLITGGLGGVGFLLAKHLAGSLKANLILTGRSIIPPRDQWENWLTSHVKDDPTSRKIRKVRELEELGANVMVCSADAAHLEQMREVFTKAEKRFTKINGVIHAAGITDWKKFKIIDEIDNETCETHFQAKVYGLFVLEHLLERREIDFCLLTSSISSVLGGLGYAAYSTANLFMDAFTRRHNRDNKSPWLTVNWDGWQLEEENEEGDTSGQVPEEQLTMTPAEGIKAFRRVLTWNYTPQLVHSVGDLQTRLNRWVNLESAGDRKEEESSTREEKNYDRSSLSARLLSPRSQLEKKLVEIWQAFFGIQPIGIRDDFFELGGDSLKAMIIIGRISKELNVRISVKEFFQRPTIMEVAEYLERSMNILCEAVPPVEQREYYPQSSAQRRLFFLSRLEGIDTSYNVSTVLRVNGQFDSNRYENAFQRLIARHEALRTSFGLVKHDLVQFVQKKVNFNTREIPIGDGSADEEDIKQAINDFIRPFDLSEAPLLRVGFLRLPENGHLLIFDMHHIICDGTSLGILVGDFVSFYNGEELPPLKLQYKDYACWQTQLSGSEKKKITEEYWFGILPGKIPQLNLRTDYPRPAVFNFEGDIYQFKLDRSETLRLKKLAADTGATLFMKFLAILYILLYKYTHQEDIIIGTTISGRPHSELESIIGAFINKLVLRNYPCDDKSFPEFLMEVKTSSINAFEHQDMQFEELVEKLGIDRHPSKNPLFDVTFVFQNFEKSKKEIQGTAFVPHAYQTRTSRFDISMLVYDGGDEFYFDIEYCTALFKRSTIIKMAERYKDILAQVMDNEKIKLKDIRISYHLEDADASVPSIDFGF